MELTFNLADPLGLANVKACAEAARLAYDAPTFTDPASGESVFVADCGTASFIAFPGTRSFADLRTDLNFPRREAMIMGKTCSVHRGFDASYSRIGNLLRGNGVFNGRPIFVTGHSKGAALARRFILELARWGTSPLAAFIVFGEPRGGDSRYVSICNGVLGDRCLSIANGADPVPWMPGYFLGNRPLIPNGYLPPDKNILASNVSLIYELSRNCLEIYRGWKNFELDVVNDHSLADYTRRLEAI